MKKVLLYGQLLVLALISSYAVGSAKSSKLSDKVNEFQKTTNTYKTNPNNDSLKKVAETSKAVAKTVKNPDLSNKISDTANYLKHATLTLKNLSAQDLYDVTHCAVNKLALFLTKAQEEEAQAKAAEAQAKAQVSL